MLKREALRRRVNNMVDNAFIPWIIQWSTQQTERFIKMARDRLQDFPALAETLQSVQDVTKACNVFITKGLQNEAAKIKDYVKKVAQLEKIIMNLEIEKTDL
ncbi:hypothetical protein AMECASPLE_007093 [Ameca splendens]|uniref:Uncharacterized protein n=1 Tax=Ameca splendens TaxID=208324 RepID=A0ABV0YMR1_9TELE